VAATASTSSTDTVHSNPTIRRPGKSRGAARRTIERRFRVETGMSVATWRRRLRLVEALRLLAAGEPVSRVAPAVGYSTPSAFGAMFVRHMGTTPGRYFGAPNADGLGSNADA
jgi:AraC-like DNA-binding protein